MQKLLSTQKISVALVGIYVLFLISCANKNLSDPIPEQPNVLTSKFESGLSLYLYLSPYDYEYDTIFMQITVRAGMLHEEEDEIGLAHFIEHMAFNSTEKYNQKEFASLERELGIVTGAHSNASTGLTETNYVLSMQNPTPERLELFFDIMSQRAFHLAFDPEEVEKERGVILAEEQLYLSDESLLENAHLMGKQLEGSLYAERYSIGKTEIVKTATPEQLKKYYDKWYTPSNMAVAILGDINMAEVFPLLSKYFATVEKPESPPQPTIKMHDPYSRKFDVYINPTSYITHLSIRNLYNINYTNAVSNISDTITESVLQTFLQVLFSNYLHSKKFDSAIIDFDISPTIPVAPKENVFQSIVYFGLDEHNIDQGIEEAQNFLATVHSVLQDKKYKKEILASVPIFINQYKAPYPPELEEMGQAIVNNFVFGAPILDNSQLGPYLKTIEKQISQEDILRMFEKRIYNPADQIIFVSTRNEQNPIAQDQNPSNTATRTVDLEKLFVNTITKEIDLFPEYEGKPIEEYITIRDPREIITEEVYADKSSEATVYEWKLSNGQKVVYYFTNTTSDFNIKVTNNDILKNLYHVGNINIPAVFNMALDFSFKDDMLVKDLLSSDWFFNNYFNFDLLSYSLSTEGTEDNIEWLFRQLYVINEVTRVDEAALNRAKHLYLLNFYESLQEPDFYKKLVRKSLVYKNHPNFVDPLNEQSITDISMDDMNKVSNIMFNSNSTTFFMHGSVDVDLIADFVEWYIAPLPAENSYSKYYDQIDYEIEPFEGKLTRVDSSPIATINYDYYSPIPDEELHTSDKEQIIFRFASMYLESIINDRMREELGQIYYVDIQASKNLNKSKSSGEYSLNINFDTDVEFADSLFAEVKTILDNITPIDTTLVEEIRNVMLRFAENSKYDIDSIDGLEFRYNLLPLFLSEVQGEKIVNEITAQDIENTIKKVLEGKKIAFITLPKNL